MVAPVDVLRFDDTVHRLLGDNLEVTLRPRPSSSSTRAPYQARQLAARVPGALVKEMAFTP